MEINKSSKAIRPMCSICTSSRYDIKAILNDMRNAGEVIELYPESQVLHRIYGPDKIDVFYFSYGTIVVWGLTKLESEKIIKELSPYEIRPLDEIEYDETKYFIGEQAKIVNDIIGLPAKDVLTRLAFSHGLAQSVKLSVFEKLIVWRINQSRNAPESLAQKGRIPWSRKQLAKMMGKIIVDRNSINLHTDILDTPEFFWEHSDLEPLYHLISKDLDITSRVNVLNRRLDILKDLFEVLNNELENRHSSTLEWIIIVLISIEVVVTFAKDIFHII